MSKLAEAIENFSVTLLREGFSGGDLHIILPEGAFYMLCWEIQKHSGKYLRRHPDGSTEEGSTTGLVVNTSYGKVYVSKGSK